MITTLALRIGAIQFLENATTFKRIVMTTMLVPMIAVILKPDVSTFRETAMTKTSALWIFAIPKLDAVTSLAIAMIIMLAQLTDVHQPKDVSISRESAMITTLALAISAILQVDVNSFPSNCHQ